MVQILPIVVAPDPVLKSVALPVAEVTAEIRTLMDNMYATMINANGIGLAANQVSVLKRIIVAEVEYYENEQDPAKAQPVKMANPEILSFSEDLFEVGEGCLSFPDVYEDRERPNTIVVRYIDENNQPQERTFDGLLSFCIQHEIEHLDGIVLTDKMAKAKSKMVNEKLRKLKKKHSFNRYPIG